MDIINKQREHRENEEKKKRKIWIMERKSEIF